LGSTGVGGRVSHCGSASTSVAIVMVRREERSEAVHLHISLK
jgi:hypothetical protein